MSKQRKGYQRQPSFQAPKKRWIEPKVLIDFIMQSFGGTRRPDASNQRVVSRVPSLRYRRSPETSKRLIEEARVKRQRRIMRNKRNWTEYLATYYAVDKLKLAGGDRESISQGSAEPATQ